MKDKIPVVGYLRVSTDEQVEGFSLGFQEERINAYAKSQDYLLLEIYQDNGYSAKDLNRPAIKRLLEDAKKGKFKIILVYRLDRLTRRLKDLSDIVEILEKQGVKFQSVTESFETKTASGRLMMNVFGGFAQFEREVTLERIHLGIKRRFEKGMWLTSPPYGYNMRKGNLAINKEESFVVQKIYKMYLKEDYGLVTLARKLNDEGYRNRRNKKWRSCSLYRILTHKVYCGYTIWKNKERKGLHQPIIDEITFELVKKALKERRNFTARRLSTPHILTGLINCKKCGSSMFIQRPGGEKRNYRYYVCGNRVLDHSCEQEYISADKLENNIKNKIREVSENPDLIREKVKKFKEDKLAESFLLDKEANKIRKEIEKITKEENRLTEWSIKTLPNKLAQDLMNRKIELLEEKKQKLQERLLVLESAEKRFCFEKISPENICGFLKELDFSGENLNISQKKLLFETLVKNIFVWSKSRISLKLRLPLSPLFSSFSDGSQLERHWWSRGDSNP